MSMSVATKYASYIQPILGDMLELEIKAKGLATAFHEKVQLIMSELFKGREFNGKEASSLYVDVCREVEKQLSAEVTKHLGKDANLSDGVPNWRGYKSIYKNAMAMGLNPCDYSTYSKYKLAKLNVGTTDEGEVDDGDKSASKGGDTSNASTSSVAASPVSTSPDITSKLSDELRNELNHAVAQLTKLYEVDPDAAKDVVDNLNGACYAKLRKAGGRFAHMNKA